MCKTLHKMLYGGSYGQIILYIAIGKICHALVIFMAQVIKPEMPSRWQLIKCDIHHIRMHVIFFLNTFFR